MNDTTTTRELPKGWRMVRLGDHVTKIGSGVTPTGGHVAYQRMGIPLIRSQNVLMGGFTREGLAYISAEQDAVMSGSRVQVGDVLLNITGASIGRVCIVPPELCPANVNQHVSIIRPRATLDPEWLALFLACPSFQDFIWDSQAGATRQALTKALIENFLVPLAPLPEQRRIAGVLREQMGAVARARAALAAQLAAAEALPAALLRRAFAGEV